jgi:hypothetical protein
VELDSLWYYHLGGWIFSLSESNSFEEALTIDVQLVHSLMWEVG